MLITNVIFDFDGVIAEQGFRQALAELTPDNNVELTDIAKQGMRALLKSGYVTGQGSEADFWALLSVSTKLVGDSATLRAAVIRCSSLRPQMLALVDQLRSRGVPVALLSDHTDWLDEIAASTGLAGHFDYFYNSYHLQRSKRDPLVFDQVLTLMGRNAEQTLFVDDNPANVERAIDRGLQGIVYQNYAQFSEEMSALGLAKAVINAAED
ncbi:MAG: hypothetical protein DRQ54_01085 [Gammaproteobacteria bacterium]|nr:MAG: hypothetical protein DRQ54_01085 [Gammaproteobacteria bacterium]